MCNILLVDSNAFFRHTLRDILNSRFPEIKIKEAENCDNCMKDVATLRPQILFIDAQLSGNDGFRIVRDLREKYPAIIIIILTDYNLDEYRTATIQAGGNHTISKELWTGKEILNLVETVFRNSGIALKTNTKDELLETDFFDTPLERRRKGLNRQKIEREFLAIYPDRRKKERSK